MDETDDYMKIRSRTDCPCGSKEMYHDCCRPYHIGKKSPATAELLMKSRYSAFFFRLVDYLVSTHHPDTRGKDLSEELDNVVDHMMWRSLKIVGKSKGTAADKKGKVEFIAQYHCDGEFLELQENSRFRKHKGQWKYVGDR